MQARIRGAFIANEKKKHLPIRVLAVQTTSEASAHPGAVRDQLHPAPLMTIHVDNPSGKAEFWPAPVNFGSNVSPIVFFRHCSMTVLRV